MNPTLPLFEGGKDVDRVEVETRERLGGDLDRVVLTGDEVDRADGEVDGIQLVVRDGEGEAPRGAVVDAYEGEGAAVLAEADEGGEVRVVEGEGVAAGGLDAHGGEGGGRVGGERERRTPVGDGGEGQGRAARKGGGFGGDRLRGLFRAPGAAREIERPGVVPIERGGCLLRA